MEGLHRPFATGSKPGPDAVDHYLEETGFYRKHVARDASSLFRVISEQVFDIQNYHEKIRQNCAAFMEAHKDEYANDVDKNFFNYISQLRRPRSHGSLLELRVLAKMYKKNVILFEPTTNLQTTNYYYVKDDAYNDNEPLRVFFSQKDKHFDVIYELGYAQRLAECQAIVYDILYSSVFNLPDVQYAVERMLHDQEEQVTLPLPDDPSKYIKASGEIISFDSHTTTECVLKDPKTCHFHNQDNFEDIVNERKDAITIINQKNEPGRMKIYKPIDGFLHDKEKSCVRQLLSERITPFPYKVAKALDPSIYRNTEFELWSDNRKEQRMKWLDSADFTSKPHHEDKMMAYDCERCFRGNRKFYDAKLNRPIVDELTYMSMNEDLKKKYIILNTPTESFKIHNLTNLDNFVPAKDSLELTVMPVNTNYGRGFKKRGGGRSNSYHNHGSSNYHPNSQYFNANQYHGHQASQSQTPNATEIERESAYYQEQEPQAFFQQQQTSTNNQEVPTYDQQAVSANVQMFQQIPPPWNNQMVPFITQQPIQYPLNYQHIFPFGNFTIPPPPAVPNSEICSGDGGDLMNILREGELSSTTINWNAKECTDQNGADLPTNDIPTLQFYYNLGVRYFTAPGVQRRLEGVVQELESMKLSDVKSSTKVVAGNDADKNNDQKAGKTKSDPPPPPANTPVSTKPVTGTYGPPGHRYGNNSSHNFRRPLTHRDSYRDERNYRGNWNSQPRKEIKFNSNVRNANKGDIRTTGSASNLSSAVHTQTFKSTGESISASDINTGSSNDIPANSGNMGSMQYPPVSLSLNETQSQQQAQTMLSMDQIQQQQQQYYQTYPGPQTFIQPQQQGVSMVYQVSEDGSGYMVHPVQQQMPYSHPYPYTMPPIQPGHVYYPVPNYPQVMDGSTMSSNDSGVVDAGIYQGYQQPQVQYYPAPSYQVPQPIPMYFATSPLPQTPQITPIFPVPLQQPQVQASLQTTNSQQTPVVSVALQTTSSEKLSAKNSSEKSAENPTSS